MKLTNSKPDVGKVRLTLVLIALSLACYLLPWVTMQNLASLSTGAYDLAEWASLHPDAGNGVIGPWTSLLLRLPFACLATMATGCIAFCTRKLIALVVFLIIFVIALLPPVEFFTRGQGNPNYEQQFTLAVCTLVVGITFIKGSPSIRISFIITLLSAIALGASLIGQKMALDLLGQFNLSVGLGHGAILMPALLLTIMAKTIGSKTG